MRKSDVNTYDIFENNILSYISEDDSKLDKSIDGAPISDEIKENSKTKGVIGKIGGIGADSNEPTRNGRRYPLELWQNVEKSEYFIEGMESRTLIGEADHPNERLDYRVKEGAVVLTKYEIQNDGKVYTEFDILDTIPGRTVKTYFDAGCKLGVSSRGLGEEVMRNGEKIIDPETYQFYCFDVVAFPAVKSARMELIESTSPKKQKLINSITAEIKKCKSLDEIRFIESMSKGVNLYLDEIKEAVETKRKMLSESFKEDIDSRSYINALIKSMEDKIKEYDSQEDQITSAESDNKMLLKNIINVIRDLNWTGVDNILNENILSNLFNQLKEECDKNKNSSENNKIKISDTKTKSDEDTTDEEDGSDLQILAEIQEQLNISINENTTLKKQMEQKNVVIRNLIAKSHTNESKLIEQTNISKKLISNQKYYNNVKKEKLTLEETVKSLKKQLSSITSKCEKLQIVNKEFSSIVESLNEKYVSEKELTESLMNKIDLLKNTSLKQKTNELKESLYQTKKANKEIINLNECINTLKDENKTLKIKNESFKTENAKQSNRIKSLTSENSSINKKYHESLDKYITMVCTKYNLKESTLKRLLGESYTIKEIDKIAKELVENNSKLNSLPFAHIVPDRHIVNENIGLQELNNDNDSDMDNFHFMLESKK